MLLGLAFRQSAHFFSPVSPFEKERHFARAVRGGNQRVEENEGLICQVRRFRKGREEIAQALFMNAVNRKSDAEVRNLVLITDASRRRVHITPRSTQIR